MSSPSRVERAEQLTWLIEQMIAAHIARFVHMSTNDKPLEELHGRLITALVDLVSIEKRVARYMPKTKARNGKTTKQQHYG